MKKDIAMVKRLYKDHEGTCYGASFLVAGKEDLIRTKEMCSSLTQDLLDTLVVGDIVEYEVEYAGCYHHKFLRNLSYEERIKKFNKRREQYQKTLTKGR